MERSRSLLEAVQRISVYFVGDCDLRRLYLWGIIYSLAVLEVVVVGGPAGETAPRRGGAADEYWVLDE